MVTCNVCNKVFKSKSGLGAHRLYAGHLIDPPAPAVQVGKAEFGPATPTVFNPRLFADNIVAHTFAKFALYVKGVDYLTADEKVTILEAAIQFLEKENNAKRG